MRVYIYGIGKTAEKLVLNDMKKEVEILGFLDSDSSKWGDSVPFAPKYSVIGLQDVKKEYDYILVASVYIEIIFLLLDAGVRREKIVCISEIANINLLNRYSNEQMEAFSKILTPVAMKKNPQIKIVYPHGSHGSPINDLQYIKEHEERIFKDSILENLGIKINYLKMLEKYRLFCTLGEVLEFPLLHKEEMRYYGDNNMFGMANAHLLSQIIREFHPQKIIEVGSGFSSASMLDVNERIFKGNIKLTFIEPYADRLNSLLRPNDNIHLLNEDLQEVCIDTFKELQDGDILFVDSSHVGKVASDVNYLIFEILPQLNKGVVIHFHDIFYPFEYPKEWMLEGRAWNEAYLLRAFLQFNNQFEIIFWDGAIKNYITKNDLWEYTDRKDWLGDGSIYIRKIK